MDLSQSRIPKFARRQQAPVWYLVVVTVAIVGFFVASTVYSKRMAAKLDEMPRASPSMRPRVSRCCPPLVAPSSARGRRRARNRGRAGADAAERSATEDALRQMRAEQARYLSLPFYPGERGHWEEVDAATQAFQREVSICFAAIEKRRLEEARTILTTKLRPATERLDNGLEYLVDFHATQQRRMGLEIQTVRRRAARIAYVLDAVARPWQSSDRARGSRIAAPAAAACAFRRTTRRDGCRDRTITGAVAHDDENQPVLTAIVEEACRLVDADYAALGFLIAHDRPFDAFVFHGFSAAEVETLGRFPRPVGVLGEVISADRPLRIDDVTKHPKFRGLPNGHPPMGAFLASPCAAAAAAQATCISHDGRTASVHRRGSAHHPAARRSGGDLDGERTIVSRARRAAVRAQLLADLERPAGRLARLRADPRGVGQWSANWVRRHLRAARRR